MLSPDARLRSVFLLSPAYCGGRRATILLRSEAKSSHAVRLDEGTLTLGEAFSFLSGLYFRGKLTYARAFVSRSTESAAFVITPTRGLQPPEQPVSRTMLQEFGTLDVGSGDERFRNPLERDARALDTHLIQGAHVVLLGSIATDKYVSVLSRVFGDRLVCPRTFVGRGDMSRGALLLRSAAAGEELEYMPLTLATVRSGKRAPGIGRRPPSRAAYPY